ncbi:MAG: B12-binding domain-containing radical SAM protein [Bdellovibrionales bacterium]|nr:B12-binding domain-containing radical SAM protein [Bdellovibrionales bacterium]
MKIGFLAMSGVRVHDKELLELGLTLPAFVERGRVIASLPSLGLLYLAAVTPPGHELCYFEAESDGSEPPELYECDLVAISSFTAQILEGYQIADRLRSAGVTVAIGGLHVSAMPEEALQHADHVIVGEGEPVWPLVVDAVSRGEAGRIWLAKEHRTVNVKELPIPRYDLLSDRSYNRFTVQTSRGCPWRCEFCASNVMLGLPYRKRPVRSVRRDIERVLELREHPFIEFADDNTFVDKKWGINLCKAIEPLKIKWFTETDISLADDEKLLSAMVSAGCRQVLIGLESPSAPALDGLEQRNNFKAQQFERYRSAVQIIQSHGMTVNGCFILGLDHHTPNVFQSVYDFVDQTDLYEVQITILTPFPGTPLYRRLTAEKRIIKAGAWELCTLFDVNYQPKNMTIDQLRQGFYWLTSKLYQSDFVAKRRKAFFKSLRNRNNSLSEGRHVLAA